MRDFTTKEISEARKFAKFLIQTKKTNSQKKTNKNK